MNQKEEIRLLKKKLELYREMIAWKDMLLNRHQLNPNSRVLS